jgi:uncharacterized protein DUF2786
LEEPVAEEKMLKKIRGLLELANDERNHEGQREAAFAKAQQLMDQHRIEMAMLDYGKGTPTQAPIDYKIKIPYSKFSDKKYSMLYYVAEHCGVKCVWDGSIADLTGMQSDIEMAELVYTLVVLEFETKIEPVWSSERSFDANVYALHGAGRKWKDIAHTANRHGGNPNTGLPGSTTDGSWLKAAYRRECARQGHEPRRQTQRHEAYQESFSSSFLSTIVQRLSKMRRDADFARGGSVDNLPAIMSVKDRVNQAFWKKYPHLHPDAIEKRQAEIRQRLKDRWASMTEAERAKEQRELDRLGRSSRTTRHDEHGWAAGHNAAQRVDLLGGKNRVVNRKELG